MSAICSKDTQPEIYLRKLLFAAGIRYRKNDTRICGHPDLYIAKFKTAVFVHGCYWHRHCGCKYAYTPKTRVEFWEEKFRKNIERDKKVQMTLVEQGTKCLVVWECTIKKMKKNPVIQDEQLSMIKHFFHSPDLFLEL